MVQGRGKNRTNSVVGQRYRLLHRIGEQASTELWEAFDARLERPVALRLLAEDAREDTVAQARLRRAAREPLISHAPGAPRVLDGGDDPTYGPFVVAELSRALEATQPLRVVTPPSSAVAPPTMQTFVEPSSVRPELVQTPTRPSDELAVQPVPRRPLVAIPERRAFGLLALVAVVLVALAALVFLARTFAPANQSTGTLAAGPATAQPTWPLSGAPAGQPGPTMTTIPTLAPTRAVPVQAPPAPPTPQPTLQPTPQPTLQPTPQPTLPPTSTVQLAPPVETIRQHYTLIDARRYSDGYALMDAHLRSLNSAADYAGWFANKVSIKPLAVDLISQTAAESVVRSVVETTDRVNGQNVTTQVSEQFVLHNENGAWRIAQVSRI